MPSTPSVSHPEVPDRLPDPAVLRSIEARVLWLATRMVDHANRGRASSDGMKVGGHQASSASMTTIMTSLWFAHLRAGDLVAVKPHASPVHHAIQYLLGELDASYLLRLREFGGLQAYPSRTKDPDRVDLSTGSVGLGVAATLFAAYVARYVGSRFDVDLPDRFVGLCGDAELDEGNVWEAVLELGADGLGNVMWVVDLNRQSLDRIVPGIRARRLRGMFEAAGWHVVEAKYGERLEGLFSQPGGEGVRARLDDLTNERYQALLRAPAADLRAGLCDGAPKGARVLLDALPDDDLRDLISNLGGHDLGSLLRAYCAADKEPDRPSVVFAYTIKGAGLPIAGDRLNHSALLSAEQIDALREVTGLSEDDEWSRFGAGTPEAALCEEVGARLAREVPDAPEIIRVGVTTGARFGGVTSSQEAFGRILSSLSRSTVADRIVTTSPDVAVTTNLGGWINKRGVYAADPTPALDSDGVLRWEESRTGQHIELGISEMNLFLMLGQLGLAHEFHGERLLPIGTLYDPFICRGLDALIYGLYLGARFLFVASPSGITLSPEGGAHQSAITPSIGTELPGLTALEPAYAQALDWLLCDALEDLQDPNGDSYYLRLTTRSIPQAPWNDALERLGERQLRFDTLAGGYRLVDAEPVAAEGGPVVHLVGAGAVMPELIEAARTLHDEGVAAHVLEVTSPSRLWRGWRSYVRSGVARAVHPAEGFHLARLFRPSERRAPIVTVHDAASHSLAWFGSVFGSPTISLGVDRFGESGELAALHRTHQLDAGAIVNAALLSLSRAHELQGHRPHASEDT